MKHLYSLIKEYRYVFYLHFHSLNKLKCLCEKIIQHPILLFPAHAPGFLPKHQTKHNNNKILEHFPRVDTTGLNGKHDRIRIIR